MIHVEQKNILKKTGKETWRKQQMKTVKAISKQRRKQKTSDVKEIRLPIKRQSKHRLL